MQVTYSLQKLELCIRIIYMPKSPKTQAKSPNPFPLFNKNSFFDNNIDCPAAFDILCIKAIEKSLEPVVPSPVRALQVIISLINEMQEDPDVDLIVNTFTLRNCYFYLILMMDYCSDDMQTLMMVQMTALSLFEMYCVNLEVLYKTDYLTLVDELGKCVTFQNSANCVTPNILKENFLEMCKNKEILDYVKAKFVDVDFAEGLDADEISDLEGDMLENDKMMETLMNQMMTKMEALEKSEKPKVKKPKAKPVVKKAWVKN
jgi:hypothetical protein